MKGIDINKTFWVHYDHQSKSWHDEASMLRLSHRFNMVARHRNSDFQLLLDNCNSHLLAAKIFDPNGLQETSFVYDRIVILFSHPTRQAISSLWIKALSDLSKRVFAKAQTRTLLAEYELWQACKHKEIVANFPLTIIIIFATRCVGLKKHGIICPRILFDDVFEKSRCLPLDSQAELNSHETHRSCNVSNNAGDVYDIMKMLKRVRKDNEFAQDMGLKEGETNVVINELITFD